MEASSSREDKTLYMKEIETPEHILFFCEWAALVWFSSHLGVKWSRSMVRRIDDWWMSMLSDSSGLDDDMRSHLAFLCWNIWKDRCSFIYQNSQLDPISTSLRSNLAAMEFLSSLQSNSSSSMTLENGNSLCWVPPSKGKLKINCDGAYADLGKVAGVGVIVRNCMGDVVDGFSRRVKACSPLMTEALAIEAAMECVENFGIDVAIIESDCQVLINAIYSEAKEVDWKCSAIISNIDLAKRLPDVSFNFVGRCCNKAADWLAKVALGRMCPVDWVCAPLSSLARILASDKLGDRAGIA
ncbi:reverse transcriptase [Senna tora]|uniref:Reverse transcriptase n=1 Tax=Senna tora TaxID=362788 RepID=A0A834T1X9_9FABA|nr:reverse transcriptase [Senna tora]